MCTRGKAIVAAYENGSESLPMFVSFYDDAEHLIGYWYDLADFEWDGTVKEGMFVVYDSDKPADCYNHKVHESWNNCKFDTFEEAEKYAKQWLGAYGIGAILKPNVPFDYSGYGDTIVIKEIENAT